MASLRLLKISQSLIQKLALLPSSFTRPHAKEAFSRTQVKLCSNHELK